MLRKLTDRLVGPRPKKVNCWYCSQDSYLLPGSGQTPRHWFCNLCECTNIRDENGDIQDAQPDDNQQITSREYCVRTRLRESPQSLCERCLADQRTIRRHLDNYIPDENDPRFDSRYKSVEEFEEYLQSKNPLCAPCQLKVDEFNARQETRLPRRVESRNKVENDETNMQQKGFTIISPAFTYNLKKCVWCLAHSSVLCVSIYAYFAPPKTTQISVTLRAFLDTFLKFLNNNQLDTFSKIFNSSTWCFKSHSNDSCQMTLDYIIIYYLVNLLSIWTCYWHPNASQEFEGGDPKAKNYDVYKTWQPILLAYRLAVPVLVHSITYNLFIVSFLFYVAIALFFTLNVQVQGHKVLRKVGKNLNVTNNNTTTTTTINGQDSIYNPPVRSSSFIQDDLKEAMTYRRRKDIDYHDITLERDDDIHRTVYEMNRLRL